MITLSPVSSPNAGPDTGPASALDGEVAVLRAAIAGDEGARDQLVRLHHRRVYGFLYQMTRQREDAEDLTQHTFIKALRHLDRVDPERPVIPWLLTVARRTALNHFRDGPRWAELPEETASAEISPARQTENRDRVQNLWDRARCALSPREFEVMWLRFGEEMSTAETARVMELTQIHVKVIVHRARQQLLKGECRP